MGELRPINGPGMVASEANLSKEARLTAGSLRMRLSLRQTQPHLWGLPHQTAPLGAGFSRDGVACLSRIPYGTR